MLSNMFQHQLTNQRMPFLDISLANNSQGLLLFEMEPILLLNEKETVPQYRGTILLLRKYPYVSLRSIYHVFACRVKLS